MVGHFSIYKKRNEQKSLYNFTITAKLKYMALKTSFFSSCLNEYCNYYYIITKNTVECLCEKILYKKISI